MATLPIEFKRKIADLYLENRQKLDQVDATALESFASQVLEVIEGEKTKAPSSHDLEVLEQSMKHLKQDSALLKGYEANTDDYDFTHNDCKNLLNSTKRWLKTEQLI